MRLAPIVAVLGALGALLLPGEAVASGTVAPSGRVRALPTTPGERQQPAGRRAFPLRVTNPAALRLAKRAAARRQAARNTFSSQPRVSVFGGLNAPGMDATSTGGVVPPDTTGSIGPTNYVEIVNDAVAVYSRSTLARVAGPVDLEHFMQAPGTTVMTDPQIQWDQQAQRWFYVGLAFTKDLSGTVTGPNFLQYGYSRTTNPTNLSDWCRYSFPNGSSGGQNLLDDYPKLGHDNSHVLIGTNVFNETGNSPLTARVWSIPKTPPSCPSLSATTFGSPTSPLKTADGNMVSTPVPSNNSDSTANDYVVAADDPLEFGGSGTARNQLMVWHLNTAGTLLVQDGNIAVSSYNVPATARQPLPGGDLDTLDGRLTMAVGDADPTAGGQQAVWTQHTIDPGNGAVVMRWYELLPGSHAARQQGTISNPTNDVFNGAVSPAASGDFAAFNYNVSGPSLSPQIRARVRGPAAALGRTGGELLLGSSSAPAQDFSCVPGPCRWGDYSGASPDPSNANVVWGSNQAVGTGFPGDPAWTTRNFALTDRQPSASFSLSPGSPRTGHRETFTSTSRDPDGGALIQSWDLTGDGRFGDATGGTASLAFHRTGSHVVRLLVADPEGLASLATRTFDVKDGIPPSVKLAVRKVFAIRTAIKRGIRFRVRSSESGRISARLVISRATARRLHLVSRRFKGRTFAIGRGSARLGKAGSKRVTVKLTRRAKRALRRVRRHHSVGATLRVLVKDRAGNGKLVTRRIRLRR